MDAQFGSNVNDKAQPRTASTQPSTNPFRAGRLGSQVRERFVETGHKTDQYVRSHPGRFIAGACCVGLAAGWLLSRAGKPGRS
jgi:ElaB/YqjD/DUF883 family membrane-anchored ribosome-binding protein